MQTFKFGFLIFLLVAIFFFLNLHGLASVDIVKVTIFSNDHIAQIKDHAIGGMNVNNSMAIFKVKDMIDEMKIPSISYPCGNVWDDPARLDYNSMESMRKFKVQQKIINNPHTMLHTRPFSDPSPAAAVQAALNAKEAGVRVDLWGIGVEPDLYAPHKKDTSWIQEKYNRVFREQVEAIKSVDKNVEFAGPNVSQPYDHWVKPFIYECGDIVDVLSWHWYPTDGTWDDELALATAEDIIAQIDRYRSWLKDPETNPKGFTREIKIALSEFALHWNSPRFRHLTDMVSAMWTAEVVGYLAQNDVDYSHYFCLAEYGGHAIFEQPPSYLERPVYHVFKFYANYFGKTMLKADSSDDNLKVFASKDDQGKHYAIIINQDAKMQKVIEITLGNKASLSSPKAFVLADDVWGEKMSEAALRVEGNKLYLIVPPYSVTAVTHVL